MGNWINTYDLKGKPVISQDKPGALIEKVLDEIQEKVLTAIHGSDSGGGDTPVKIEVVRLDNNTVKLVASVDVSGSQGSGSGITDIDNGLSPNVVLSFANGVLTVSGKGFPHTHPEYALGGAQNPRELPASASLYDVLYWNGSGWVAGPILAK